MLYGLVLVVHVLVALFMIAVILLQGGRGGLGEALGGAAAQSLFGGAANVVMTKITAVVAGIFMVTCLSLAILSTAKGRSVIERIPMTSGELPLPLPGMPSAAPPTEPVATTESTTPSEPSTPVSPPDTTNPAPASSTP